MRTDDNGYWGPEDDNSGLSAAVAAAPDIEAKWLPHVKGRLCAFQAGGHCGVFPLELSKHFASVYTAEPEFDNWICLTRNCRAANVYPFRAAVGDAHGWCTVNKPQPHNSGAHFVSMGGSVPIIPIDSFELAACDLIALDVEGYEWYALKGAEKTLKRHRPTVIFEVKHSQRFQRGRTDIVNLLGGYEKVATVGIDEIWTPVGA